MKILIVSHDIPYPLYYGANVRIFNLIKHISRHFEISLICMSDKKSVKNAEFLRPFFKNIHIVPIVTDRNWMQKILLLLLPKEWPRILKRFVMLLRGVPFQVLCGYHVTFRDKLREVLKNEEFDIIQFESAKSGQYVQDLTGFVGDAKLIMVGHVIRTVEAKRFLQYMRGPKKIYYAIDYLLNLINEKKVLSKFDHIITMADLEKQKLVELGLRQNRITAIRTGVDIKQYRDTEIPGAEQRIVFLGSMKLIPNKEGLLWFLNRVFPIVKNKVENATLAVIGEEDPRITRKYTNENISFHGIVDRLETEMGKGMIFITPIRIGGGIRTKIITAMAFGMPVVTTSVGIEGIKAREAEGAIIADTEQSFADAIVELLNDDKKRYRLAENARRFVERKYSWDSISNELIAFYNSMGGGPKKDGGKK